MTREVITPYIAGSQVLIVSNETVAPLYLPTLQSALASLQVDTVILPDGEQHKTLDSWQRILETCLVNKHHRNTTLISLGGGVIGDMTGFAASSYQRGVSFIQVPTTLLAQVDASIGGKTAVNHPLGKNMIGAFHQPNAVLIDLNTLATLPAEEFACGMAEVIKAAMISDAAFFQFLEQHVEAIQAKDRKTLTQMITRSCEIKADIVASDEKEAGPRALLNLGHTFGHAIETCLGYGAIKHGQAVAIGMVLACKLAAKLTLLEPSMINKLTHLLKQYQLPTTLPSELSPSAMIDAMKLDKKNVDMNIRFILPLAIGRVEVTPVQSVNLLVEILQGEQA